MEILQIIVIICIPLVSLWLIWSGWRAIKQQSDPATPPTSQNTDEAAILSAEKKHEATNAHLPPFLDLVYCLMAKVSRTAIPEPGASRAKEPWPLFVAIMMMAMGMFGLLFAFFLAFAK